MSVGTYSLAREGDKLLSPHFRVREFACRDGADLVKIDTDLVELLERIRTAACGAVTVNSGYRTASYNQKVGGARASQHLLGRAADIQVSGASPLLVGQIAEYYLGGHGGIGVYQTFTHVDTRTARARWDQRTGGGRFRLARLAAQGGNSHGQHPQRVCGGSSGLGRGKRPFAGQRGGEPDALPARHPAAAGSGVVPLCKAGGADLIHY